MKSLFAALSPSVSWAQRSFSASDLPFELLVGLLGLS